MPVPHESGNRYIATLNQYRIPDETASKFSQRILGDWGVENKVHDVRDVTQGEDASRIKIRAWV